MPVNSCTLLGRCIECLVKLGFDETLRSILILDYKFDTIKMHYKKFNKIPSGLGFGFSSPPSCISSNAKDTLRTW